MYLQLKQKKLLLQFSQEYSQMPRSFLMATLQSHYRSITSSLATLQFPLPNIHPLHTTKATHALDSACIPIYSNFPRSQLYRFFFCGSVEHFLFQKLSRFLR